MKASSNILITGAAGFIASCMAIYLNKKGYENLILVDDFSRQDKIKNFDTIKCISKIDRNEIKLFLEKEINIDLIIHFGARTDTTEMDYSIHEKLNVTYSKMLWQYCSLKNIPFIYASSAATYGNGELGYEDKHEVVDKLQPLNPYGVSKNEFDKFVLRQIEQTASTGSPKSSQQSFKPRYWYGIKFFNVYGPNEYHKGRMASVIFHAYHQIKKTGSLKLFRSHHPNYSDGGQMRDFIYVKDILEVTFWLMNHLPESGIYNLGTGKAATFLQLANAIFQNIEIKPIIEFIDTPPDIRDKYQYFTEANMNKLISAGYTFPFYSIDTGVQDYIKNYLVEAKYFD